MSINNRHTARGEGMERFKTETSKSLYRRACCSRNEYYIFGALVEGTLRNAEQVTIYLLRKAGLLALLEVSLSTESLSLELDQETPTILGDSRITIIDAPQIGGSERGCERGTLDTERD